MPLHTWNFYDQMNFEKNYGTVEKIIFMEQSSYKILIIDAIFQLSTDGKIYAYQSERTVKIFKCKDFFVENYIFNETMEKRPMNRRISIR